MENSAEYIAITVRIKELEQQQKQEYASLSWQIRETLDTLTPSNIIKTTIHDAITLPAFQDNIIDNAIGIVTGYLSKKTMVGSSKNPFKKLLGSALQWTITSYVSKHADTIKAAGNILVNKIFSTPNNKPE